MEEIEIEVGSLSPAKMVDTTTTPTFRPLASKAGSEEAATPLILLSFVMNFQLLVLVGSNCCTAVDCVWKSVVWNGFIPMNNRKVVFCVAVVYICLAITRKLREKQRKGTRLIFEDELSDNFATIVPDPVGQRKGTRNLFQQQF